MENDIDESVERLGELFESFLKSTLQKKSNRNARPQC